MDSNILEDLILPLSVGHNTKEDSFINNYMEQVQNNSQIEMQKCLNDRGEQIHLGLFDESNDDGECIVET